MNKHRRFWALWGWPIVMGVLTTTGLLTALVSDTWGDWWSWAALGVPVAVMGWYSWPRRSAATAHAVPPPHQSIRHVRRISALSFLFP